HRLLATGRRPVCSHWSLPILDLIQERLNSRFGHFRVLFTAPSADAHCPDHLTVNYYGNSALQRRDFATACGSRVLETQIQKHVRLTLRWKSTSLLPARGRRRGFGLCRVRA